MFVGFGRISSFAYNIVIRKNTGVGLSINSLNITPGNFEEFLWRVLNYLNQSTAGENIFEKILF